MSLIATYICKHTHMHVGDDKIFIWATRLTSECAVTFCHRVLLLLLCVFGVKMLFRATQASILTAMIYIYIYIYIYILLLHIKCICQVDGYMRKTFLCVLEATCELRGC